MEYVFGRNDFTGDETLMTKGEQHTDLTGFQETVREYADSTITDAFRVVEKSKTDEDSEGNCYDWYIIDKHNRTIDKTKLVNSRVNELIVTMLEG